MRLPVPFHFFFFGGGASGGHVGINDDGGGADFELAGELAGDFAFAALLRLVLANTAKVDLYHQRKTTVVFVFVLGMQCINTCVAMKCAEMIFACLVELGEDN